MLHTEHDNKQNEHVQGSNGLDAVTKFIKMKVVNQDNSKVQVKGTKVIDQIPRSKNTTCFKNFVKNVPLHSPVIRLVTM